MEALHPHSRPTHSAARRGCVETRHVGVTAARVLLVRASKDLGVDERFVAVHSPGSFEATDRLVQVGIHQPVQGGHRSPVTKVRLVLDHDRRAVTASHHHAETALHLAAHQVLDGDDVGG